MSAGGRSALARVSLIALAAYAIVLAVSVRSVGGSSASYWAAVAAVLLITGMFVRASGLPPAFFGITVRGARASLRSALFSTALLAVAGLGFLLVTSGARVVELSSQLIAPREELELVAYVILAAPLQELVFRGVFQGTARHLLGGGFAATACSIIISAAAYAASHLPWGRTAALVMLVPGIVWGIQFQRDRTLVGVMLSHATIGYLFVGATPLWKMIIGAG